jgi:hypothetical protein
MTKYLTSRNAEIVGAETEPCPECGGIALEDEGDIIRCLDCGAYWEL